MAEITPAILSKDYEDLKNHLAMVKGYAPVVQVDICDGNFVPSVTWPFGQGGFDVHFNRILNEEEGLPFWEDMDFELDLMVKDATENFDIYEKLGPRRIIFHLDAVGELNEFKEFLEGLDSYRRDITEIGIAISMQNELEEYIHLINLVDFVQFMAIDQVGYQGQDFNEDVLEKIKEFKNKFPDVLVGVDGGVNEDSAPLLIEAGADRLAIGSAIFRSDDIVDTIEYFKELS